MATAFRRAGGAVGHNERMSTTLMLRGVTKRYRWRGPWVLSGADLSLEEGSLISIEGANGSGKSTLLRIAAGVTAPSGGAAVVPSKVGYVPERQAARCKFSATDYLTYMGRIRGLDPDEATGAGTQLLMRLGVRPGLEVSWNELSKGNRQKVVVAQAFLGRLEAVVLDEPYSGLDDEARSTLTQLISEVRAQGTAVLLSSHSSPADTSQRYRIIGGRLERWIPTYSTNDQLVRVELVHQDKWSSSEELTRRRDVVKSAVTSEGTALVLDVVSTGCDDLLRAALDLGWSIQSVIPTALDGERQIR
jgi:ABC-type Mn2+/Zn2+ transport system ATPase subunit